MSGSVFPSAVKGWCPGALRPMESGDGLIIRLKIPLGIVGVALALDLAEWSRRWGSGVIELTARANLQLRGVSWEALPGLQAALSKADLLDSDVRSEAVRNIVLSPLSDIDPDAVLPVHPMAQDLDRALRVDHRLYDLPGKFGFAIDAGGRFGTAAADVTFVACRTDNGPGFAVRLAGEPTTLFGPCVPDRLAAVAASLGSAFLALRQARSVRRMRDLVACIGVRAISEAAGLDVCASGSIVAARPDPFGLLGPYAIGMAAFVGIGLPFGQINAEDFADLANAASEFGGLDLCLTPWRTIFVPLPSLKAASRFVSRCADSRFVLKPADPRRRIAACAGAPKCRQGCVPAREDAAVLASSLGDRHGSGVVIHVSGCRKGCAHPVAAPVTLIGRRGSYDLVLNGTACGVPVREGMTLAQAAEAAVAGLGGASR